MAATAGSVAPARSGKAITLISSAHFLSHLYVFLLPPVFPLLREYYGVGYTELGFAISVLSITTGVTQAPMGFLVDRFGARTLLIGGMLLESVAIGLIGVFPGYAALLALMVVAGLANSVYHPADYAILNASVESRRMGRAFSIHTASGMLGNAVAPAAMVALLPLIGWRGALGLIGFAGAVVAVVLLINSDALRDVAQGDDGAAAADGGERAGLGLLFSAPVMMGLLFFVGISMSGGGLSAFGVAALTAIHGASVTEASLVLSIYLFTVPVGVLLGGWVADRVKRHDLNAAGCFVIVSAMLFLVAFIDPSLRLTTGLLAVAGLFGGIVSPSRDMMIRAVTPPGQMGKVFGFVSTGFNIGGIAAPLLFGWIMDHQDPRTVFWVSGAIAALTILTVLVTGREGRRAAPAAA